MTILAYLLLGLMIINVVFCILEMIKDRWAKATFHLVVSIWMWYIGTTL